MKREPDGDSTATVKDRDDDSGSTGKANDFITLSSSVLMLEQRGSTAHPALLPDTIVE
jgi:hypothetical protein